MSKTPNIFIIIAAYNAMPWAEKCFSGLRNSTLPVKTVVVDNGSKDGTQNFIQKNYPEIHLIQNQENLGFGKANNLGIEYAYKNNADFFYLLNQDAWILEDTLEKLLNTYINHPNKAEIGILSPMHLDGTGEHLDIFLDKYIANNFKNTRLISDLYFQKIKDFYPISFINAAHWFLPKETIEKVGGFNPYFFHYGEDNEYVNRLHYHGKKILLCPASKAIHDGNQSLEKVNRKIYKNLDIETHIINPNYKNAYLEEKKELQKSILKNVFLGNFKKAETLRTQLKKINQEKKLLLEIKEKVSKTGPTFLKL